MIRCEKCNGEVMSKETSKIVNMKQYNVLA